MNDCRVFAHREYALTRVEIQNAQRYMWWRACASSISYEILREQDTKVRIVLFGYSERYNSTARGRGKSRRRGSCAFRSTEDRWKVLPTHSLPPYDTHAEEQTAENLLIARDAR